MTQRKTHTQKRFCTIDIAQSSEGKDRPCPYDSQRSSAVTASWWYRRHPPQTFVTIFGRVQNYWWLIRSRIDNRRNNTSPIPTGRWILRSNFGGCLNNLMNPNSNSWVQVKGFIYFFLHSRLMVGSVKSKIFMASLFVSFACFVFTKRQMGATHGRPSAYKTDEGIT